MIEEEISKVLEALRGGVRRAETAHVTGYFVGEMVRLDLKAGSLKGSPESAPTYPSWARKMPLMQAEKT